MAAWLARHRAFLVVGAMWAAAGSEISAPPDDPAVCPQTPEFGVAARVDGDATQRDRPEPRRAA